MSHTCHVPDCKMEVPPERLMCYPHWKMVPKDLQAAVWRHYRPGQCDDKKPSAMYLQVANQAIQAVQVKLEKRKTA